MLKMFGDRCYFRHGYKSSFTGLVSLVTQKPTYPSCFRTRKIYVAQIAIEVNSSPLLF